MELKRRPSPNVSGEKVSDNGLAVMFHEHERQDPFDDLIHQLDMRAEAVFCYWLWSADYLPTCFEQIFAFLTSDQPYACS